MTLVLTTERLRLTPLTFTDVDLAIEMFTDPAVVKFVGNLMVEDEILRKIQVWTKRGGPNGCIGIWCVANRETGEQYGTGALLPIPIVEDDTKWDQIVPGAMPDGEVEVGYILKPSAWGKGYATEICLRLLKFAFEETPLKEVVATLDDENEMSRNVLEKSGFTYHGRRWAYAEDSPDYRISRDEWIELTDGEHA